MCYNEAVIDWRTIRTSDIWYTIGYITADGNLSCDGRHINITSKDVSHLNKIKQALKLKNKITMKGRGGNAEKIYGALQFGDVKFYRFLQNIGLKINKSRVLERIFIPNLYFKDFLRGLIDGDGNIHFWNHPQNGCEQWTLRIYSGSPIFAKWLLDEISTYFFVRGSLIIGQRNRKSIIYILKLGKMAARQVLGKCYYEGSLSLDRKYKLANKCVQSYFGWSHSQTVNTNVSRDGEMVDSQHLKCCG